MCLCALRDAEAHIYAVAVGAIVRVLVVVCSACAGIIFVDVIKWRIAVCTYA